MKRINLIKGIGTIGVLGLIGVATVSSLSSCNEVTKITKNFGNFSMFREYFNKQISKIDSISCKRSADFSGLEMNDNNMLDYVNKEITLRIWELLALNAMRNNGQWAMFNGRETGEISNIAFTLEKFSITLDFDYNVLNSNEKIHYYANNLEISAIGFYDTPDCDYALGNKLEIWAENYFEIGNIFPNTIFPNSEWD